jgi:hypothetical protein
MKQLLFRLLLCGISITATGEQSFGQQVYEQETIRLTRDAIPFPIFYSSNGFTSVFNAPDLLKADVLQPMLERYSELAQEGNPVSISDLIDLEHYDSMRVNELIAIRRSMNELYKAGQLQLFNAVQKQEKSITRFREEKVPMAGTNYYYAAAKDGVRSFEYFLVSTGCPAF